MAAQTTVISFAAQVQPGVWKQLKAMALSGNIANGYLFSGPSGVGKEGTALSFAALLNCTHPTEKPCGTCPACRRFATLQHEHLSLLFPLPGQSGSSGETRDPLDSLSEADLDYVTEALAHKAADPFYTIQVPRANRIRIQSIRYLRRHLYLKSSEPGYKVIIVLAAHTLSSGSGESANALLKLLEEPPPRTTLILVTDQHDVLLPTILSRCQHIAFPPLPVDTITALLPAPEDKPVALAAFLSGGNMNAARHLAALSAADITEQVTRTVRSFMPGQAQEQRLVFHELSALARSDKEAFRARLTEAQFFFSLLQKELAGLAPPDCCAPLAPALKAASHRYPQANVADIILSLESLKRAPQANLNLDLALAATALEIRRFLQGANPHSISREIAP